MFRKQTKMVRKIHCILAALLLSSKFITRLVDFIVHDNDALLVTYISFFKDIEQTEKMMLTWRIKNGTYSLYVCFRCSKCI